VVVVHVAPGNQLIPAGLVNGAAVPAAVWTVDSAAGKVQATGRPPGSPSAGDLKHAADALMRGEPAPSLGELDLAERGLMQLRSVSMPRAVSGLLGIFLFYFAIRYGIGGLLSLMILPSLLGAGSYPSNPGKVIAVAQLVVNTLLLAGVVLGAGLFFNFRNLALRMPGFSSGSSTARNVSWGAYIAVMIGLALALDVVLPGAERKSGVTASQSEYTHVTSTVADDGGEIYVVVNGDVTVDLSGWPQSEWSGVEFTTSNPSVLSLDSKPADGAAPIAKFTAHQAGASRVSASSTDGRYSFQVRVDVGPPPT
jgi:hypothetical protein